jgi:hypothetical protein
MPEPENTGMTTPFAHPPRFVTGFKNALLMRPLRRNIECLELGQVEDSTVFTPERARLR